jgi:hypothetical protein
MCYGHIACKKIDDVFHKFGTYYTFKGYDTWD